MIWWNWYLLVFSFSLYSVDWNASWVFVHDRLGFWCAAVGIHAELVTEFYMQWHGQCQQSTHRVHKFSYWSACCMMMTMLIKKQKTRIEMMLQKVWMMSNIIPSLISLNISFSLMCSSLYWLNVFPFPSFSKYFSSYYLLIVYSCSPFLYIFHFFFLFFYLKHFHSI